MGLLGKVFGRSAPPAPDLDALFALPGATLTLQSALGLAPTGLGSVCFREAEGAAAAGAVTDVTALLCSVLGLADPAGRHVGLVYLYKRGTFYPFAPTGGKTRDNALELQVRAAVGADLPVEADLSRWFPVWAAPGL